MKNVISTIFLAGFTVAASVAAIAEEGAIRVSNIAMKQVVTVDESGTSNVSYVEPRTAVPGDVILYTIEFENISEDVAEGIYIDGPVPNNSFYRDGSATGKDTRIEFSLDGKSFDSPDKLMVERDGRKQLASAKDYASVRWHYTKQLRPGDKHAVSFKTQIRNPGE